MALFRKFFYSKPPEGLLEISDRFFVFDSCFAGNVSGVSEYQVYLRRILNQVREYFTNASFLVFNFGDGEQRRLLTNVAAEYGMTVIDFPHQYENCPVLSLEMIHHFLKSSESWLIVGLNNVVLMHCEDGALPVLAFMLAASLIYRKQYSGEQRTLDMIYKQTPVEILHLLTPLNPLPSQLRYLQYVSRRNIGSQWPPLDRALTLDCIILRIIPNMDGEGGCRPIIRIYGLDPLMAADRTTKVLYSTPKSSKAHYYKQADCELAKMDISCHVQGDVVLECITLDDTLQHEEIMFRVMFNTAFIRSNMLMLTCDEIDILWNAKGKFSEDFRAEVFFSEMDSSSSIIGPDSPAIQDSEGLPIEAFAGVHDIFGYLDWRGSKTDIAQNMIQQMTANSILRENLEITASASPRRENWQNVLPKSVKDEQLECALLQNAIEKIMETGSIQGSESIPKSDDLVNDLAISEPTTSSGSSLASLESFLHSDFVTKSKELQVSVQRPTQSKIISPRLFQASSVSNPDSLGNSLINSSAAVSRFRNAPSKLGIMALLHDHSGFSDREVSSALNPSQQQPLPSAVSPPPPPPPPPLKSSTQLDVSELSGSSLSSQSLSQSQPKPSVSSFMSAVPPPPPPPLKTDSLPDTALPPPPSPPLLQSDKTQLSGVPSLLPEVPPPPPLPPSSKVLLDKPSETATSTQSSMHQEKPSTTTTSQSPPQPPPPPPSTDGSSSAAVKLPPPPPPCPPSSSPNKSPASAGGGVPPPPPPHLNGLSKPGTGVPSSGNIPAPPLGAKGKLQPRTNMRNQGQQKKSNLKPYHWLKLTRAIQGSLWAEAQKPEEASKAPELDMSELESLFSAAAPNSTRRGTSEKRNKHGSGNKSEKVHLIDLRRAYNCEIMLTKVKVPLPELMNSVLTLDCSALDVDQVDNLIKFCPTKEEIELLKNYKGDKENLGKCEQFFLEMMKVPRVEAKLRVFSFKIQFFTQIAELRNNLNIVNSVSEEVRNSVKLKRIMQTILSLGNALNQGTARGSAVGFRLDSLLKLTETRARNNKLTLMHYLCKVLAEKLPNVLDFDKDLTSIEAATKIQLKYLAEEMQAISKGLEKVAQELTLSENDGAVSEHFCKILKEFYGSAEEEVRSLASLYSGVGRKADALALYFGEDPARCPFEQVVSTLLNFVRMFHRAHEENCKQLELEKKTAQKDAEQGNAKQSTSKKELENESVALSAAKVSEFQSQQ